MLVMLVGVTTVLLLIMGTVSTYLLARRVDSQITLSNSRLTTRASILAKDRQASTGFYAAVEIPIGPRLVVRQLTRGRLSHQLAIDVRKWLTSDGSAQIRALAQQGRLTKAELSGCHQFPYVGCQPFDISNQIQVASSWGAPAKTGTATAADFDPAIFVVGEQVNTDPAQVRGFIIAELITGAALIALLALAGEWLIGQGLEPLDEMTRTADEITSRGDLAARMPDVDQQTEVGRLGASINTMLDRIQNAFNSRLRSEQKVREFAADASHELRTPLTTIRGYAELYRQGALGPDELPNAMRRIEQEAQRMSTLVAELLELARLDRTSSLDLSESDLASVVRDAVADAVAVEPQRPVRAEAPPRLVAVVDEPRIRQVLANLLGNVRAHTPATTPVAVRLGQITDGVLIEVADAGPGMSVEDAIRAFDRFHRAQSGVLGGAAPWDHGADRSVPESGHDHDGSHPVPPSGNGSGAAQHNGSRRHRHAANGTAAADVAASRAIVEQSGGSGLGLSIVQAIATAHGGQATLESRPGHGTKVRVWLPVRIVP
jgi:signal transduction histidine kinase